MPTILRSGRFRLFFYAGDGTEPAHVHIEAANCQAKYWLEPVRLANSAGFSGRELRQIESLVNEHHDAIVEAWHDYFED